MHHDFFRLNLFLLLQLAYFRSYVGQKMGFRLISLLSLRACFIFLLKIHIQLTCCPLALQLSTILSLQPSSHLVFLSSIFCHLAFQQTSLLVYWHFSPLALLSSGLSSFLSFLSLLFSLFLFFSLLASPSSSQLVYFGSILIF